MSPLGAVRSAGRRAFRLALVTVLAVGCAACDAKGGSTASGPVETPRLRVGVMPILSDVAFFIALDTKMFERAGLHVTAVPITGAEQGVPMLQQGKLDLTFGNWVSFLKYQAGGTQLRIVADASEAARHNYVIAVKPTSPIRVTMNAFFAAALASSLKYQNPTSRNEHTPTSSQKMYSSTIFSEMTSPSMEKVNSAM